MEGRIQPTDLVFATCALKGHLNFIEEESRVYTDEAFCLTTASKSWSQNLNAGSGGAESNPLTLLCNLETLTSAEASGLLERSFIQPLPRPLPLVFSSTSTFNFLQITGLLIF